MLQFMGSQRAGHDLLTEQQQQGSSEFLQSQGDSEGQGSLACCSLWHGKELDRT